MAVAGRRGTGRSDQQGPRVARGRDRVVTGMRLTAAQGLPRSPATWPVATRQDQVCCRRGQLVYRPIDLKSQITINMIYGHIDDIVGIRSHKELSNAAFPLKIPAGIDRDSEYPCDDKRVVLQVRQTS